MFLQVVEVLQAKVEGEETTEVQENMEVEDDYVGVEDVVEVEDDDDDIVFYGFATSEIPLPMIIKVSLLKEKGLVHISLSIRKGWPKWALFINFELQYSGHLYFMSNRLRITNLQKSAKFLQTD